ncbi:MAG: hypothetical protein ABIH41_02260, partial [Nanoarchaeota archaeon]
VSTTVGERDRLGITHQLMRIDQYGEPLDAISISMQDGQPTITGMETMYGAISEDTGTHTLVGIIEGQEVYRVPFKTTSTKVTDDFSHEEGIIGTVAEEPLQQIQVMVPSVHVDTIMIKDVTGRTVSRSKVIDIPQLIE